MAHSDNGHDHGIVPGQQAFRLSKAGQVLDLSERTVWSLVHSGELRAIRVGKSVRIPATEIQRFLHEKLEEARMSRLTFSDRIDAAVRIGEAGHQHEALEILKNRSRGG